MSTSVTMNSSILATSSSSVYAPISSVSSSAKTNPANQNLTTDSADCDDHRQPGLYQYQANNSTKIDRNGFYVPNGEIKKGRKNAGSMIKVYGMYNRRKAPSLNYFFIFFLV